MCDFVLEHPIYYEQEVLFELCNSSILETFFLDYSR